MDKIVVHGGHRLAGEVSVSGAKNSVLPLLFSSLLAEGRHHFKNVPELADVSSAIELLQALGCRVERRPHEIFVEVGPNKQIMAPYEIVRKMRASILVLGPLLARHGEARVSLPGGCAIGTRPIDLHLEGLKQMGVEVELEAGYINAKCTRLAGASILFDSPTVGGTENLMMAACLAHGETVIENAAKEPEIVDLANYLNAMGARISGAGTGILRILGVRSLQAASHEVICDRIEAGTLMIAAAITKGDVMVKGARPSDLEALIVKLKEAGAVLDMGENYVRVSANGGLKGVDITTAPHPGFPTDLQAQFMALASVVQGTSIISETVFENRFMHVQELVRLGADITPKSRVAVVRGKILGLRGAPVMATDLRASACLVLAGLQAEGQTTISRIYHLDRGYENLEGKLKSLGAKIDRVKSD